jgi:type VI secretion system protein ImpH
MSGTQRRPPPALIAQLLAQPHGFGFFQAVRLLQRWLGRAEGLSDRRVLDERLRFRNSLALDFPASELASLEVVPADDEDVVEPGAPIDGGHEVHRRADGSGNGSDREPGSGHASGASRSRDNIGSSAVGHDLRGERAAKPTPNGDAGGVPLPSSIRRIDITPAFIGLLGATGALPTHYTEQLAQRELYHRDHAARAFLDIFQHRAVALFYEGWRKHRLALHYEADGRNRFLPLVLAVAGLGQPALRDRLRAAAGGVSDHAIAFYAGAVHKRGLAPQALERMVAMYFDVRARLTTFVGRWYRMPASQHSIVGLGHATLGRDAVLGERVWQRDLRLRLDLGPLDLEKFNRFLPGGPAQIALREILQLLGGNGLEYEVCLRLAASEVRGCRLDATRGAWLGWNSFLVTRLQREDRSDVRYDLLALT